MIKKIFIFNLILTMFFNFIPVCAEANDILEQKESIENEPYKTLEEKKKELKEERRLMDQQRLEEIKQKEKEKKEKLGEVESENPPNATEKERYKKEKGKSK